MTDAIAKTGTTVENDVMNFEKMTFAQNAKYGSITCKNNEFIKKSLIR